MLKTKDKKNIKKFVDIYLEVNKDKVDEWLKYKHLYKTDVRKEDGIDFRLSLKVPSELANMLTTDYPKLFEKGPDLEWFKKEFDIFVM